MSLDPAEFTTRGAQSTRSGSDRGLLGALSVIPGERSPQQFEQFQMQSQLQLESVMATIDIEHSAYQPAAEKSLALTPAARAAAEAHGRNRWRKESAKSPRMLRSPMRAKSPAATRRATMGQASHTPVATLTFSRNDLATAYETAGYASVGVCTGKSQPRRVCVQHAVFVLLDGIGGND